MVSRFRFFTDADTGRMVSPMQRFAHLDKLSLLALLAFTGYLLLPLFA